MKFFVHLIFMFVVVFSSNSWSEQHSVHREHAHAHKHGHGSHQHGDSMFTQKVSSLTGKCEDLIVIKVNGLVCDFCARALEKVFGKNKDVKGINVDLDKGVIEIEMVAGKSIDDKTLNKSITDSGYNLVEINRGCS